MDAGNFRTFWKEDYCGKMKLNKEEKGMPCQTLISAMIHQYVEGGLVENETG